MEGRAVTAGLSKYLASLLVTVLFPLRWMRVAKLARHYESEDANGLKKVGAAALAGVLLAGVGVVMLVNFEDGATTGLYDTLDGRLSTALGNDKFNEHSELARLAQERVDGANAKLAAGEDPAIWEPNRDNAAAERDEEQAKADALAANAALYGVVSEFVQAQDDAGAKSVIANRGAIDYPNLDAGAEAAFATKDASVAQMKGFLNWLVWPGVIGVFFAPMVLAGGSILRNSYVPSDTVGFKQYPAGAMALFLLFGGFGVPALFFAAWTFQDYDMRMEAGQISL